MAQNRAPNRPSRLQQFTDPRAGVLTSTAFQLLDQLWRQIAAGFPTVPCTAAGTANAVTLTPRLHKEGGLILGDGMSFSFEAVATMTGAGTIELANHSALKAYIDDGATQANSGDVVDGSFYVAYYLSSLDSGAGGFVLK